MALVAIAGLLGACGSATRGGATSSSRQGGPTPTTSSSATPGGLTLVYQAVNSTDHAIHEAVISGSLIADHIIVDDPAISFLLGFTDRTTIAVRKDAPGAGKTEIGVIDIRTGAYHEVISTVHSSTEEMLGPTLSPHGNYAAYVFQNGLSADWVVLDMTTGQTRSLNLAHGGGVIAWTSSYILFNTGAGLIEVDPLTGGRSAVANSSDYSAASPDATHLAGAVYRNLGDPNWCLNTVVTGSPAGAERVIATGKNTMYGLLGVANNGDVLFTQSTCDGPQARSGNASVELSVSGQVIQQFQASDAGLWANAQFVAESSALMEHVTLVQGITPDGPGAVSTGSELDLVGLCAVSGCQPSTLRISQAEGLAARYLYFTGPG